MQNRRIIDRLRQEAERIVNDVGAGKRDPVAAQAEVAQRIDQLGTIVLKSLERADRVVAREGAWALKRLLDHYGTRKPRLPPGWFAVDRADFVGLSDEALEMLSTSHTWYEMKVGHQMWHAYQSALARASDTISTLSDANRRYWWNTSYTARTLPLRMAARRKLLKKRMPRRSASSSPRAAARAAAAATVSPLATCSPCTAFAPLGTRMVS